MSSASSPAETLSGSPAYKSIPSGDIKSLLQDQQDALRWTLALNEAIKSWTDEHALAIAQEPSSPSGAGPTKKWIKFDDFTASNRCEDGASEINMIASTQAPTKREPFQGLPSCDRIRSDFAKLCSNISPSGSPQSSLKEPLLSDANPMGQEREHKERTTVQNEDNGSYRMVRGASVEQLLFPAPDEATIIVQGYLNRPEITVEDLYKTEGMFQAWAKSKLFNNVSLVVILLNTIWIAVDTNNNKTEILCNAPLIFQVMDNFFCIFFCAELLIRLMAFKQKMYALSDPWYIFDAVLVAFMVWETWIQVLLYLTVGAESFQYGHTATIFRIFRLARLTRVARTGKLLRSTPELMILAKAMFLALRSVMAILVMLTLVIYVFAILFTQLLSDSEVAKGKFEDVPQSMNFLLIQLLCGFDSEFMLNLSKAGLVYYITFLIFLLIANMTIMNMLIGILCDVVSGVSNSEKEENFVKEIQSQLEILAAKIDPDGDRRVSRDEFLNIMRDYDLIQALNDTGVDVLAFMSYASFVFQDDVELSCEDFMRLIVQFRGDRVATVKELVGTRKYVTNLFETMELRMNRLESK